jgi:hypothetical protein
MVETSDAALISFIGGPAIIANACAILQSGAAVRHNLAITQWRELNAAAAGQPERLAAMYSDPVKFAALARERIWLQLSQTRLLMLAAGLFASTSFLALISAMSAIAESRSAALAASAMLMATGLSAIGLMFVATYKFFRECVCAERMMAFHILLRPDKPA